MGDGTLAVLRRDSNLPDPILVLLHRVRYSVPLVWQKNQSKDALDEKKSERTEFADQDCLLCVRSPLAVSHRAVLRDVEAKLSVTSGECVVSALHIVYRVLPLLEKAMSVYDVVRMLFEPGIDRKHSLPVNGLGCHACRRPAIGSPGGLEKVEMGRYGVGGEGGRTGIHAAVFAHLRPDSGTRPTQTQGA